MQKDTDNNKSQMRKGMLEYCILLLLNGKKSYPGDMISQLKDAHMIVVEGTLYTLLNRMRREGKLDYEWQESPKGPPRKYYYATKEGLDTLASLTEAWDEISLTVNHLRGEHASGSDLNSDIHPIV